MEKLPSCKLATLFTSRARQFQLHLTNTFPNGATIDEAEQAFASWIHNTEPRAHCCPACNAYNKPIVAENSEQLCWGCCAWMILIFDKKDRSTITTQWKLKYPHLV